jgi:dihydroorotase
MQMGMTLEQVIERATVTPAKIFALGAELGTLRPGMPADLSILELVGGDYEFVDSGGKRRTGRERLVPRATLRDGVLHEPTPL